MIPHYNQSYAQSGGMRWESCENTSIQKILLFLDTRKQGTLNFKGNNFSKK